MQSVVDRNVVMRHMTVVMQRRDLFLVVMWTIAHFLSQVLVNVGLRMVGNWAETNYLGRIIVLCVTEY